MNYRSKLLAAISAVSIFVLVTTIFTATFRLRNTLQERTLLDINTLGAILAAELTGDIIENDTYDIKQKISLSVEHTHLVLVSLLAGDGLVLFSSARELTGSRNPYPDSRDLAGERGEVFFRSFPLTNNNATLGWVQLGYSLKKLRQDINRVTSASLLVGLLGLFLILAVAWVISGRLLRPLQEMETMANRSAQGDFSARVAGESRDIIGALGRALNHMAGQLADLTGNLQQRIADKTRSLEAANRELQYKTAELEESNRRLRELDKTKSEFVSMVSHELRTPLTGIIGFAQTLQNLALPPEQQERYLTIITTEGKRLAGMIEDYLDVSKIQLGNLELDCQPVSLPELVAETIEALGPQAACTVNFPAGFPLVPADRNRIKQVLMNLLSNALRYTAPGKQVAVTGEDRPESVTIHITDQGPGIRREDQRKIFEKFFRGQDELSQRSRGSGLGLAIAKGMVELHGGKIWVVSEPGQGSIFSFSLPKPAPQTEKKT